MDIRELVIGYNNIVKVVPGIEKAAIDICSLTNEINSSNPFVNFKVSLIPSEQVSMLVNYDASTFESDLASIEDLMLNSVRYIGFYPKFNTTFERFIHVPILRKSTLGAVDPDVLSSFEIPVEVIFYRFFNNNISMIKRYFNSTIYCDHTTYSLIPSCILNQYSTSSIYPNYEMFVQNTYSTIYPDPDIQDYGIDFTYANNFSFVIDDDDLLAQSRHIAFIEVVFNLHHIFDKLKFYAILRTNSSTVYLKKINIKDFSYRKVFYNLDFMNIKNKILKHI